MNYTTIIWATCVLAVLAVAAGNSAASQTDEERTESKEVVDQAQEHAGDAVADAELKASMEAYDYPPELTDEVVRAVARGKAHIVQYVGVGPGDYSACTKPEATRQAVSISRPNNESDSSETESERFQFEDCERLYDRLEDFEEFVQIGADPWEVQFTVATALHDGERVASLPCTSRFGCAGAFYEPGGSVDSLVGPILSTRSSYTEADAGGRSAHRQTADTIDLRDGESAELTHVITEESLVDAIRNDDWIRGRFDEDDVQQIDSLQKIHELFEDFTEFGEYAFYEWDPERQKVAMRIWFPDRHSARAPNELSALGVWVTPRSDYERYFEKAEQKKGFYMSSEHHPRPFQ